MNSKSINLKFLFCFTLGLVAGISYTHLYLNYNFEPNLITPQIQKRQGSLGLINHLLECNASPDENLSVKINKLINQKYPKNSGIYTSVFFKEINSNSYFSINAETEILPGSLMKVPLMIGYLEQSEKSQNFLNQKILFNDKSLLAFYDVQGYQPKEKLKIGNKYSLSDLISAAIIHSDNVAAILLERFDNHTSIKKASFEMDIPVRAGVPPLRKLTIKEFAGFFQILYNATYLSEDNSNKALQLLSQSEFNEGIVAGVPSGIKVAHKFGEAVGGESYYLNDCGIIYSNPTPYLLCVSASAKQKINLAKPIAEISHLVYQEIKNKNLQKLTNN